MYQDGDWAHTLGPQPRSSTGATSLRSFTPSADAEEITAVQAAEAPHSCICRDTFREERKCGNWKARLGDERNQGISSAIKRLGAHGICTDRTPVSGPATNACDKSFLVQMVKFSIGHSKNV